MPNYSGYAAVINGSAFPHIKMADPDAGVEIHTITGAGQIDPMDFSRAFMQTEIPIETQDLLRTFGSLMPDPIIGLACESTSTFQWQLASNGEFTSGSTHFVISSPRGYLYLKEINADQDSREPATAQLHYCPLTKTNVNPYQYLTVSSAAALSGTPALTTHYSMGPLYINGVQRRGILKGRLTTGIRYQPVRTDGDITAAEGKVEDRNLQLEFDLNDLSAVSSLFPSSYPGWGLAPAAGQVAWYLQKCVTGADRVAWNLGQHIKFTFDVSTIELQSVGGGRKTDAVMKLIIHLKNQGMAVTTGSTIP